MQRQPLPQDTSKQPDPAAQTSERERKRKVFKEMIALQESFLLRAGYRLCQGNRDHAEDLVQETLLRGYEAFLAGRFQENTNSRAWFMRILTNVYLSEYRRRKWVSDVDVDSIGANGGYVPEAMCALPQDRPDTALLGGTLSEPLEKALYALTQELRVCVIMVDIEDFSYAEVANMLNIPIGTVRSRLSRARLQLHALLQDFAKEIGRV